MHRDDPSHRAPEVETNRTSSETLIGRQKSETRPPSAANHAISDSHAAAEKLDFWAAHRRNEAQVAQPINDDEHTSAVWTGESPLQLQLRNGKFIRSVWIPAATAENIVKVYAGAGIGLALCTTAQSGPIVQLPPSSNVVTLVASAPFASPCLVTASSEQIDPTGNGQVTATVANTVAVSSIADPVAISSVADPVSSASDFPSGATPFYLSSASFSIQSPLTPGTFGNVAFGAGQNIYITAFSVFGSRLQPNPCGLYIGSVGNLLLAWLGDFTALSQILKFNPSAFSSPVDIYIVPASDPIGAWNAQVNLIGYVL